MNRRDDVYRQENTDGTWSGEERRARPFIDRNLVAEVVKAVNAETKPLSDDERQWVRLAIQREAQSIKLRQAIIEKTLGGLVWAAMIGFGFLLLDYLKTHGINLTPR